MMEKVSRETPDLTQDNIAKIAALFPDAVTEATDADGKVTLAVDFDALRDDLSSEVVDGPRERYQFTWPGKREAKLEARRPIKKTMRPCPEKSKDWDTTENLYIEGDNLEALKIMRETYAGKVKLIYIDPPYNTGSDFVYADDFSISAKEYRAENGDFDDEGNRLIKNVETRGRFHSDWCSMIYARLMLARDLLSDDGIIFISIDDNELINLHKISQDVFGEENIESIITVVVKPEGRRYGLIAKTQEYLLVVTKKPGCASVNEVETPGAKFKYQDASGGFNLQGLRNRNVRAFNSKNRPNLRYPFWVDVKRPDQNGMFEVSVDYIEGWQEVWASTVDGLDSVWRWGKEKARSQNDELVACRGTNNEIRVFQKIRKLTQSPKSLWTNKEFQSNVGTKEISSLLKKGAFDFPKPVGLIKEIVQIATDEESIVLDFFSGSATTAEAVMRKNAEDGGKRRFILVQLPVPTSGGWGNLCNVGEKRIRCAGKTIEAEIRDSNKQLEFGAELKSVPDIGFRVLRVDDSCLKDEFAAPDQYDQAQLDLFADNAAEGAAPLDLLFQVLPTFRIEYSAKIAERILGGKTCFDVNDGQLIACFDEDVDTEALEAIAKERPLYAVFRDACFSNDAAVANLEELFKTFSPDTIKKVI